MTVGIGGAWPFTNYQGGGPAINGTYEYRLRNHWALEVGDTTIVHTTTFSNGQIYGSDCNQYPQITCTVSYFYSSSTALGRVTTIPFGPRWIVPVRNGRAELWLGAGGAHLWTPSSYTYRTSVFGIEANMGARIAVDKQRHIWLGVTGRYLKDFNTSPRQWMTWTADVGFRFK